MRTLKLYVGIILVLVAVGLLAGTFFTTGCSNTILAVALLCVILGIVLVVLGGKSADKIGGK